MNIFDNISITTQMHIPEINREEVSLYISGIEPLEILT